MRCSSRETSFVRSRVVPGGVDLARFGSVGRDEARKALGVPAGIRVVGSVGRLEPVKGHKTLIEALPYLPGDMVVVVVGQGSEANGLKGVQGFGRAEELPAGTAASGVAPDQVSWV